MIRKKRITIMLLGAASLLILTIAVPSGKPGSDPAPAAVPVPGMVPAASKPLPGATQEQLARQRERLQELDWGRNPFADQGRLGQAPTRHAPKGEPVLTGISIRGAQRWAIINQQVVGVGDRLDSGHQVVTIDRKSVTLEKDGKKLVLNLGENQ